METVGATLLRGIEVVEVVQRLASFYTYSTVVVQFCYVMKNRLEGQTSFLLGYELEEVAEEALEATKRLADRIRELGGAVTAPLGWSRG